MLLDVSRGLYKAYNKVKKIPHLVKIIGFECFSEPMSQQ